jgi:hypothetical protein
MQLRPETLYVSEWPFHPGRLELREAGSGECYVIASSREELELKMASMGLRPDWTHMPARYSIYTVRSLT